MSTKPDTRQAGYDARRVLGKPADINLPTSTIRLLLGLTVREFAMLLPPRSDSRKWSAAHICYIETGRRQASPELLAAIQALVDIHVPPKVRDVDVVA